MVKKKDDFKKKLFLTIVLGYSGIDKFILGRVKKGFRSLFLFFISIISFLNFQFILEKIYFFTQNVIFSTRWFFSLFISSSFILKHFPRGFGLFSLTLLIFLFLIFLFGAYIMWIDDIISVIKREDF